MRPNYRNIFGFLGLLGLLFFARSFLRYAHSHNPLGFINRMSSNSETSQLIALGILLAVVLLIVRWRLRPRPPSPPNPPSDPRSHFRLPPPRPLSRPRGRTTAFASHTRFR